MSCLPQFGVVIFAQALKAALVTNARLFLQRVVRINCSLAFGFSFFDHLGKNFVFFLRRQKRKSFIVVPLISL